MKRLNGFRPLAIFIISFLVITGITPSAVAVSSKKLRVSNQIEIAFPSVFKLSKSGCTSLTLKVKLNRNFDSDSQVTVYIQDDLFRTVSYKSWYGEDLSQKVNTKTLQLTEKIKLCRDIYYDSESDQEIFPSYKGSYTMVLIFDGSDYKEVSSSLKLSE